MMSDVDNLLNDIRGLASMMFVMDNGEIESWIRERVGDGEEVKLIRQAFADFFDFGVAYGVSATIETLQRLEVIPRIHKDPDPNEGL